ncbi:MULTISPECIES: hypothetical protein [Sulfolobaceae]|uniref:hypothetical protein n=1 Tax=Sulfolobaceae TaxID=118883 RepID=UPI00117DA34B|nr:MULTISPECIES: hypothetical protein [unclassified Sulfolobus]TRM87635.1 hypothetical protein DJ529_07890 [Sulfolobus sp. C3]
MYRSSEKYLKELFDEVTNVIAQYSNDTQKMLKKLEETINKYGVVLHIDVNEDEYILINFILGRSKYKIKIGDGNLLLLNERGRVLLEYVI